MIKKRAFALALTLWIVAMMSLVSVLYLSYGKKVVLKTSKINTKLELIFKSESTIELLKFYISTGYINKNSVSNNSLNQLFPSLPISLKIDGTKEVFDNSTVVIQDTAGLININDRDAIGNYLLSKNASIEDKSIIEDSMADWLDIDKFSTLNGAEDSYYFSKKYAYGARSESYFASIEELFLVRGVADKFTYSERKRIASNLFLSNSIIRNILTMKPSLLGKIYGLTQNEIEQLIEAKKDGNDYFLSLFYKFNIKDSDVDRDGIFSSSILKVTVNSSSDGVDKNSTLLIDFRIDKDRAFHVLEYYD